MIFMCKTFGEECKCLLLNDYLIRDHNYSVTLVTLGSTFNHLRDILLYIVTCQAHPALVKKVNQISGLFLLIFLSEWLSSLPIVKCLMCIRSLTTSV